MNNMTYVPKDYYTGKSDRIEENELTLDSNMVGYLYALSSKNLSFEEYSKLKKTFNGEQFRIIMDIIDKDFKNIKFYTTPQVIEEVIACANAQHDYGIVHFLESLCKIKIPRTRASKTRYAEVIADLITAYTTPDIALSNNSPQLQSAIAGEIKKGEVNYADAKIVAENNTLNGKPLITRNEKHLIEMNMVKIRNNLRSEAILKVNRKFLKSHKVLIPNKHVRANLNSKKATTFRISEIPHLIEL